MNQRLDRIFPENEHHKVLKEKEVYELEIIEDQFERNDDKINSADLDQGNPRTFQSAKKERRPEILAKIPVKEMDSPIKFTINYGKAAKGKIMNKLWVYLSFEDKEPDRKHCDHCFNTPSSFKIFAPFKAKKFEQKFLYLSLQSEQGCSVKLHYVFMEPI